MRTVRREREALTFVSSRRPALFVCAQDPEARDAARRREIDRVLAATSDVQVLELDETSMTVEDVSNA